MPLLRRVATVSGWTLGSRVLGLVRDRMLAGAFGGSLLLDAFLLAFALPNLFRNLFGEGALSAAFLPRYVQARDRDADHAEAFAGLVLARLTVLLAVIAAACMAVAGYLAATRSGQAALVATLALPQLPYLVLICVSAIAAGVLNGRRHFWIPAAAPVLLNCALIAAVWWKPEVGLLPWVVLGAGVLQLAVHLIALAAHGGMPRPRWRSTSDLRDLRGAFLPVLFATGVFQLNALLDSVIAFVLVPGAGAVAYLFFANRLFQFPLALVAHGVGTAVYPEVSTAAVGGWEPAVGAIRKAAFLIMALLLPATVGLAVVAEPLAGTLFQHGEFGAEALRRTALAASCFALGLAPVALAKVCVRACHACRDQRTPLRIGLVSVIVNLALNLALVLTPLREAGLALATSITATGSCLVYLAVLKHRAGIAPLTLRALLRPSLASLVMGLAVWALLAWWPALPAPGPAYHGPRLAAGVGLGIAVYAALMGRSLARLRPPRS